MYRLYVEIEPDVTLGTYRNDEELRIAVGSLSRLFKTTQGWLIVHPINPQRTLRADWEPFK
jgi:hypothetical protein